MGWIIFNRTGMESGYLLGGEGQIVKDYIIESIETKKIIGKIEVEDCKFGPPLSVVV